MRTCLALLVSSMLVMCSSSDSIRGRVALLASEEACPDNCSGHGSCKRAVVRTANETINGGTGEGGLPLSHGGKNPNAVAPLRCECYAGWGGEDCGSELNDLDNCVNRCSDGQGNCVKGKCQCFHPFTGEDCSVDTCPNFCSGHGKCTDKGCACFGDFSGVSCAIPMCTELDHCNGHGTCNRHGKCECEHGFTGEDCNLAGCPDDCSGHGVCGYGMECSCTEGWAGENCAMQACGSGCLHGTCTKTGECMCQFGWRGESCDMRECDEPCDVHGECDAFGKCKCDAGWHDKTCSTPMCHLNCSNHGICSEDHRCMCDEGYDAPFCVHKVCRVSKSGHVCNNHGVCNDGECLCEPGWYGADCEEHECPSVEDKFGVIKNCSGHGQCHPGSNGKCTCDEGFVGPMCSEITCPENCHGRGECVIRASGRGAKCKCVDGWKGISCNVKSCPNKCSGNGYCLYGSCYCWGNFSGPACQEKTCPNMCSQHGVCENATTNPTCVCEEGWTDEDCNRVACPAEETEAGACSGHGKCGKKKWLPDYGNCTCEKGWKGIACNIPACPNFCNFRGKCIYGECVCQKGWTGDACDKMQCKNLCSGHGDCVINMINTTVRNETNASMPNFNKTVEDGVVCKCHQGWGGPSNDCRWNVTCAEDCNGNGDCLDGKCFCSHGWSGATCKTKTCPNMCSGHGVCRENRTCACQADYTGETCDVQRCPNDCGGRSHGICFNLKCVCNKHFMGVDCSEARCKNDCSKHGKCVQGKCNCQIGYGGEDCSVRLCPGVDEPCSGNGECDGANGKCICSRGWEGRMCAISTCLDRGVWNATARSCNCKPGYQGTICNERLCSVNSETGIECSAHGICNRTVGVCSCDVGFTGENCAAAYSLLPAVNKTSHGMPGGNETLDSAASKLDALESAQMLNITATKEAHASQVKAHEANLTSDLMEPEIVEEHIVETNETSKNGTNTTKVIVVPKTVVVPSKPIVEAENFTAKLEKSKPAATTLVSNYSKFRNETEERLAFEKAHPELYPAKPLAPPKRSDQFVNANYEKPTVGLAQKRKIPMASSFQFKQRSGHAADIADALHELNLESDNAGSSLLRSQR